MPIIEVNDLSKNYLIRHQQAQVGRYSSLREVVTNKIKNLLARKNPGSSGGEQKKEVFWALKDVSFKVEQGDRLGIIGRNGAGKTTLLKILSRITEPTEGSIKLLGRVASLLEVGTGFHPELTGRENIFLNGAILGMKKEEIKRKFDEIVWFSEVEKFLDTPVKRYSSGMYVRLAFAVAAHLEPEILLVDEVLAVGDAEFQKKCLGKMGEVSKEGRTVLFVSHNMTAIQTLCANTILLKQGEIAKSGPTKEVVEYYLTKDHSTYYERSWGDDRTAGNDMVKLTSAKIQILNSMSLEIFVNTEFNIIFKYYCDCQIELNLSVIIWNLNGECIFNVVTKSLKTKTGYYQSVLNIPANLLNDGRYSIQLFFVKDTSVAFHTIRDVLVFDVHDIEREGNWYGKWIGAVRPNLEFYTQEL